MPKISVVIPVYNAAEYLEQCLDSVLNQTMPEVEVLCADDCSKDNSLEILNRYKEQDDRVKVFHFSQPRSALIARKVGVMEATGEYILFLDADDYLEPDACRQIYDKIKQENVEILHFSSRVVNCANLPQARVDSNQRLLEPCTQRITNVFDACFKQQKFFITLWNKLFSAQLCKTAFAHMEDKYLPKAQDLYSFFIIAHFAKSYIGWKSEPLHNYCLGRGVVGSATMNADKFERYCTQANVVTALRTFCENQNILPQCSKVIDQYYKKWLEECVRIWKTQLPKELAPQGWDILCRYFDCRKVIGCLANLFWFQRPEIASAMKDMARIPMKGREIRTICIYYYHFTTGGVQRVISLLSVLFQKMGYKVVLITDKAPSDEDFPLPAGVIRDTIFNIDITTKDNVENRVSGWDALMKKYHFDAIFYHAWTGNIMLWDFLYLKQAGVPVIVQAHSVFSYAVNKFQSAFYELAKVIPLADGLVVLSEADKAFWDAYAPRVYTIPNPIAPELEQAQRVKWENKSLIWVGRVSNEKQPWAIFTIMAGVVQQVPDAKLYLLGDFDDPKWKDLAVKNGVQNNVIFCGMQQNVNDYYRNASILVSTSKYEGFPMTMLEAQAHGLPTVMFNMPYLTLGVPEFGVVGVDQMDCTAAANAIACLLKDRELWEHTSDLARSGYEWLKGYDYEAAWNRVLTGADAPVSITPQVRNMIHTFVNHYEEGFKFQESQKKQLQVVSADPVSYKIGRFITFIPRKFQGAIQCCRDHGFVYTVKWGIKKVLNRLLRR